jgi:hypothetical protein
MNWHDIEVLEAQITGVTVCVSCHRATNVVIDATMSLEFICGRCWDLWNEFDLCERGSWHLCSPKTSRR